MRLHIARSRRSGLFGKKYQLTARLEVSPEERDAIRSHRLDRLELFADQAYRDHLYARADHAYGRLRALPLFESTPQENAALLAKTLFHLTRQFTFLARADMAFRITVGDLVSPSGISVTNQLNGIRQIEHALIKSLDAVADTIGVALDYQHGEEDVFAPGEPDTGTPPSQWPLSW